jgi:hypothetical protein
MKARIVILPDGQLSAFIDEGTFEAGAVELEKLFKKLEASGIKIDSLSQAEQHRHDQPHEHTKEVNHG